MRFVTFGAVLRVLAIVLTALILGRPVNLAAQESDDPRVRRGIDAYLLGDLAGAASALDSVPANAAREDRAVAQLYVGMIAFARDDRASARAAFGRALDEMPSLRPDPELHSPSRLSLFQEVQAERVAAWRLQGEQAEGAGQDSAAVARWTAVLAAVPGDSEARDAITRLGGSPPAAAAPPATAVTTPPPSAPPATPVATRSAAAAMGLGILIPGGGEFYVGRPGRGMLVLGGAAAAVAAGLLITRVEVECLSVPVGGQCPPGDVIGENETRPYLTAGLAAAGALALIGAVDAALGANRGAATRLGSRLNVGLDGRVQVTLMQWRR